MQSSELVNKFIQAKRNGERHTGGAISAKTAEIYRVRLHVAEQLLGHPLAEMTFEEGNTLIRRMREKNLSASSVNLTITAVRQFFYWALRSDQPINTGENPMDDIHMTSYDSRKRVPRVLREEQFERLLRSIAQIDREQEENAVSSGVRGQNLAWVQDESRLAKKLLPLKLMYYTGLRISEALSLRLDDILAEGVIVQGKGDKERFVPAPAWLLEELNDYAATFGGDEYVFVPLRQPADGVEKPVGHATLQRVFKQGVKDAQLPEWVTPHTLRHSFATQAMARTGRLDIVQDILGHASPNTTRRYAHTTRRDLTEAAKGIWDHPNP